MSASQVVSIRFTTEELEYLQNQQLEGESISTTAKRLILGTNYKPRKQNVIDDEIINQIKEEIKLELRDEMTKEIQPLRDAILEDREKLERVANTVNDIAEAASTIKSVNTVNTVNKQQEEFSFKDMTKTELKKILDESGIKYSQRATQAQLVDLCLKKNFG